MIVRRRPKWRRATRTGLRASVVFIVGVPLLVVGTAAAGFGLLLFGNLPGTVPQENPVLESQPSYVYDAQGNQIAVFREFDLTVPMKKDDVPQVLKNAVVAAEDRRFWVHEGIDPQGLVRAALSNYREGTVVQGGSTITQQYVKARYLSTERTLSRKLNEAVLATRVERELADELGSSRAAKEEILFRYLDETYFGGGSYGAGAAAQTYFRKDVKNLTASEAATIAGVIPSPSKLGPRDNILLAEAGRQRVLRSMFDEGMISQQEFDQAWAQPLWYVGFGLPQEGQQVTLVYPPQESGASQYPYFVDYVQKYLIDQYTAEFGPEEAARLVYRGGLRIDTTIDPRLQGLAENAINNELKGSEFPTDMSLVSVEPSTGYVKTFVGGRDFAQSQVNLAMGGDTGMQPGSAFKTYTMAAAIEQGFGPDTTYPGGPYVEPGCRDAGGKPCEALTGTGGDMRAGAAASSNAYFVQLARDVGAKNIAEMARRLGVSRFSASWDADPATTCVSPRITLGQCSVSPLDMASAYATVANHGVKPNVAPVVKVTAPDGALITDNTKPVGTPVLNPAIADTVTDILRGVVDGGTGKRANIDRPVVGKTGTTDNNTDIWFVGYTPQLVAAVWKGHADGQKTLGPNAFGGEAGARTWAAFMKPAMEGQPVLDFAVPGPLPVPRTEGLDEPARKRANQQSIAQFPTDCGGPCVKAPSLPAPAPPPTAPPTTAPAAPDSSSTTTTEKKGGN
jgi:penicillin-binding protein 1A